MIPFRADEWLARFYSSYEKVAVWANIEKVTCNPDGDIWVGRRHIARAKTLRELTQKCDQIDFWLLPSDLEGEPVVRLIRARFGDIKWMPLELDVDGEGAAFEWLILKSVSYEGPGFDVLLEKAPEEVKQAVQPPASVAQA